MSASPPKSEPAPRPARPRRAADAPALAMWHAGWAVACALAVLVAPWLGLSLNGPSAFGLLALIAPGLAGLLLLLQDGPRERLLLLAGWTLAGAAGAVMTGGLTGSLSALIFMPLAAAVAMGGHRRAQLGVLGTLACAGAGLVGAAIGAPPPAMPGVAALAAVMTLAALGAALALSWRARDRCLHEAETVTQRVEALLAALPSLTLVIDPAGRVQAAYGAPPPGVSIDALFDQGLIAAVHAPDRPAVLSALDKALVGVEAQTLFTPRIALDRRAGLTLRRLDPEAGPNARLVAQLHDASASYAREARAESARAEAEAQSAGKTRFLANMSHELRTPLNAVLGFSDIMRQRLFGPLPQKYADYAQSIHEAGGHLLDLINDILDVSKIEADRYVLTPEPMDAREAVSAALTLVRLGAEEKDVTLAGVLPNEPLPVTADRRALKQIALNLLSNAVKFTPQGGTVTLTADIVGPYLELVVADTGVGIAPEDLARLGRPFEQAGSARQRAQGTGLGLSLVRSLAELHGGRMSLDSTLGEGTAVTVRLPVAVMPKPSEGGEVVALRAPAEG